jgi:16S rRNA (adenine1518-N6/adenine1519-N6)-dimethyltransferase
MSDLLAQSQEICRIFEIKPSRSKGQNFLINERIYDDIIKAADLQPSDTVVEIGPGLGFLTAKLAKQVKRVLAVELDDRLASYLQVGIDSQGVENVEIIHSDILKVNLSEYLAVDEPYKIVANLPYNISSIFLRTFLSGQHQPTNLILMLQQEVAQRIVAQPPDMSILAVSVQYYAQPAIVRLVKAGNFWPEPKVDSAIIKLDVAAKITDSAADKFFFRVVRTGFSSKRKMLKNNLAGGLNLAPNIIVKIFSAQSLDLSIRAEELSLLDWQKIVAALKPFVV